MDGLRARKKAATHRIIQHTATALFLEKGYDDVTIEEIAAASDVSARTLFRYFPTKEHLVFGDETEHVTAMIETLATHDVAAEPISALHDTLTTIGEIIGLPLSTHAQIIRGSNSLQGPALKVQSTRRDALLNAMAAALERSPNDVDLHLVVSASMAALATATQTWDIDDELDFSNHLASVLGKLRGGLTLSA